MEIEVGKGTKIDIDLQEGYRSQTPVLIIIGICTSKWMVNGFRTSHHVDTCTYELHNVEE